VDVAIGTEEEAKAAVVTDPAQVRVEHSQITSPEVKGDLERAVEALLKLGPDALVVKRGARGSTVYTREGQAIRAIQADPFPVEVGFLKGWDWHRAARMGNACGAIVATRHGCANFMPYEHEALQFIEERGGF